MSAAILVEGLGRRFSGQWVVSHVGFEVAEGEAVLLTGENGAGKTTLLRMLATLVAPSRGRISWFGSEDCTHVRGTLWLLSHSLQLYEDLSARENVAIVVRQLGLDVRSVASALDHVGLEYAADRAVRTYSAGMRKRVGLARMWAVAPRLVLLDEPFGQLDPDGKALMETTVRSLRERGVTVVLASHDISRASALCERRLHMESGQVVYDGAVNT